jgi:hypothetical protein
MAENRTLQFLGYAYGNAPVLLNAHINGTIVFSGEVPTIDAPIPSTPGLPGNQTLFSVENSPLFSTDFSGAYPMTISVANGYGVLVGEINCNYMRFIDTVGNVAYPGNATAFLDCFTGIPTNSEGTQDPRSSVTIDGVTQVPPTPVSKGTWVWEINTGSTLGCNLNVSLGNVAA